MVKEQKALACMLFSGPYGSQDADIMARIAERALDMGYGVKIFLYGDGVHAQMSGQRPKAFFNVGDALERIAKKGGNIKSCVRCSEARGYLDGGYDDDNERYISSKSLDAVRIYSLYGFIDMIKDAHTILTFGST
ncbi:sulfur reduction protein DsrE [archaeon]|nr:MAG: sulfur reduction protein DsrE [archaeon]